MSVPVTGTLVPYADGNFYVANAVNLSPTGYTITQHISPITTDADGSTVTFNLAVSDWHLVVLGGNRTLAVSNATVGQGFTLLLQNDGSARTPTWFSGISWIGNGFVAPTMPTTASAYLTATFKCIATNTYLGWWMGNSAA